MNPNRTTQNEHTVEIRLLNKSDLAAAIRLKEQAHWNQTESDWQRLLELESLGCFAACIDMGVIGTITTATYGTELAWIGMVLVHPDFRRLGIATRLMQKALDYLQRVGVSTIKLDATPDGRPLYESLGFTAEAVIERWEGVGQPATTQNLSVMDEQTRSAVYAIDRLAFGADRTALLDSLITDSCVVPLIARASADEGLRGYALARRGSKAFYLGPVVAIDGQTATVLLDGILSQLVGEKVCIDFHSDFGINSEILAERGLVKQRELIRMRYGKESGAGTSKLVFAIAGPEVG
jgi:GNAT superfamily N-acetyltransferase